MNKLIMTLVLIGASSISSQAAITTFSDLSAWQTALAAPEAAFTTTATNILTATEVAALPSANTLLATKTLTFLNANTGLGLDFTLEATQAGTGTGAGFTFDDDENAGNFVTFDNALSVGDINNFENDDWTLTVTAGSVMATGFILRDNEFTAGETATFNFANGESASFNTLAQLNGSVFLGVISDNSTLTSITFNEDSGGDDIAIADFRFGNFMTVPEPSAALLSCFGLLGLTLRRKRSK